MSGMLSWFTGNNAQKRKAAPKDAIVALRAHLEMLQKREAHLQIQIDEQQAIAKKNITTNKTGKLVRSASEIYALLKWDHLPQLTERLYVEEADVCLVNSRKSCLDAEEAT